jgi:hypothetical protein
VKLQVKGYNELIALDDKQLAQIKRSYKYIGSQYAGATQEMQNQLVEMNYKIKELEHEIVVLKATHKSEMLEKEILTQQDKNENQLLRMQMENAGTVYGLEKQNYELRIQLMSKDYK